MTYLQFPVGLIMLQILTVTPADSGKVIGHGEIRVNSQLLKPVMMETGSCRLDKIYFS